MLPLILQLKFSVECEFQSVNKTGHLIITHEAPITSGFAAEISTKVQVEYENVY